MKHFPVKDSEEFLRFFDPDLNPEIDITKLWSDSTIKIKYRREDGMIARILVRSLFKRKNLSKGYLIGQLAKDVPGFMEIFEQDLNPDIDPETLKTTDKVCIRYHDGSGRLREAKLYSIIVTLRNHESGIYKAYTGPADIVGFDPKFWSYCTVTDDSERERIVHLSKKSAIRLPMLCRKGHPFEATPYQIFHHAEPCPYCRGRKIKAGLSDAASADPEIADFWAEPNVDITTVSPIAQKSFHFKCPHCGHTFTRYMNQIIYRHPKCPVCHDTGRQPADADTFDLKDLPYDARWFLLSDKREPVRVGKESAVVEESKAV